MDNALQNFKETILKEYPRMGMDDTFKFKCYSDISCFNQCCRDINIFLTPYDVLNLKRKLDISSTEFLEKYALMPIDKNQQYPIVMLRMQDTDEKQCHFVKEKTGCSVYENRPWACRMYPIGLASPPEGSSESEFYFLMHEEKECKGLQEDKSWTLKEWIDNEGIERYNEFGELYKSVIQHSFFLEGNQLNTQQMDMFHMVCYDLDRFRGFVFDSTFLERFEVDETRVNKMREEDEALLEFGYDWLRFSLLKEPTMKMREEAKAAVQAKAKGDNKQ
jgi:uncharacterized protein